MTASLALPLAVLAVWAALAAYALTPISPAATLDAIRAAVEATALSPEGASTQPSSP